MSGTIVWALVTGFITGGVWVGIVLLRRQHKLSERQPLLFRELQERWDQLESVDQRLAEIEERLAFAERLLTQQRDAGRLSSPNS